MFGSITDRIHLLRRHGWAVAALLCLGAVDAVPAHALPPLWKQLTPRKRVEADPQGDYSLQQHNGPWLVMAKSFDGPDGEREARELVLDLRENFNLPAYHYSLTFKLDDQGSAEGSSSRGPGRGIDSYGGVIKRRYRRGDQVLQHAVLVGDFASLEEQSAQDALEQIKVIRPKSLEVAEGETTSQSLASVRDFYRKAKERSGKQVVKGPMGHAFIASNPLLPPEYFSPRGVDADIVKLNEDLEYSLLNCPSRFSVRVATFRGHSSLKEAQDPAKTSKRTRTATADDPLVIAAKNAHYLTAALRSRGWEAYEMHDRFESYVTVGSFDDGRIQSDGRIVMNDSNAQKIIYAFGALSPQSIFDRPVDSKLEEQRKQQFKNLFSNGYGQVMEGLNPKRFVGLPLDIQPQAVEVPRASVSASLARQ